MVFVRHPAPSPLLPPRSHIGPLQPLPEGHPRLPLTPPHPFPPPPPNAPLQPLPEGHPDCLQGKAFVFSVVMDSTRRGDADDLVKRHGG